MLALAAAPAAAQSPGIATRPALVLGASDTDPRQQLDHVVGVRLLADGGVLVGEAVAARVRVYDRTGRHVRDLGGRGGGPGELRALLALERPAGDTVPLLDERGASLRITTGGRLVERTALDLPPLAGESFNVVPWGLLADGRVLLRGAERLFGAPPGRRDQRFSVYAAGVGGTRADTIGTFAAREVEMRDGMPWPLAPPTDLQYASAPDGTVWLASAREFRLRRFSPQGRVLAQVRETPRRPPLTARDLAEQRAQLVARGTTPNDRRVIGEWADALPAADRSPAFRAFFVDALGRLWVEAWQRTAAGAGQWRVYDARGGFLFEVTAPAGLDLKDANGAAVVGVAVDDFGRETVRVHALNGA